jgi:NADPH-dependent 2,4-dienoyl-CoA reductase/sulfur reductase-like enzyme
MERDPDILVIGAGAAGMAAAITASELGLRTVLLDEQGAPGGQIYRGITAVSRSMADRLGPDYRHGRTLTDALAGSSAVLEPSTTVWDVDADLNVATLRDGVADQWRPRHLIIATGALERAVPVPGWTLPGVMFAGAAQLMLKTASSIPAGRVVLAGNGPLLLLVANQLLDAGARVVALVETTGFADVLSGLPYLPRALGASEYLMKGVAMMSALRRSGLRRIRGATGLAVLGAQRAEALQVTSSRGVERVDADLVLLHAGVIPNTQLSRLMRLDHTWDEAQMSWRPRVDEWGRSSDARVSIAGDGAGIGGARVAEAGGRLAALDAAVALGRIDAGERARLATAAQAEVRRHLRVRPMLDAIYRAPDWVMAPSDETIVCRCEEVTAGEIRRMTELGCRGPNQTKAFSRCGMGPCQGRVCGPTVEALLSKESGLSPQEVGQYRIRPPLKPVPLSAIAALASRDDGRASSETT